MTRSNWCSVVSRTEVRVSIPALLTMMSSRPKATTVRVDEPLDVGHVADVGLDRLARPAAAPISLDRGVGAPAFLWKFTVTAAPWRPSSSAMAWPMPLSPPVTIADLPCRDIRSSCQP